MRCETSRLISILQPGNPTDPSIVPAWLEHIAPWSLGIVVHRQEMRDDERMGLYIGVIGPGPGGTRRETETARHLCARTASLLPN